MSNRPLQKCIWTFLFILVHTMAYNQSDDKINLVDGILWNGEGDTIHGSLLFVNEFNFQFNVTLSDSNGSPGTYYSPKDLEGFIYRIGSELFEFHSMPNPKDMGKIFLRILYDGRLSLYQYLEIDYRKSLMSFNASFFIWKRDWIEPPITVGYEQKSLLYHFSDCPELEYKIKTAEYGISEIRKIVTLYEDCDLTDEYEFLYE